MEQKINVAKLLKDCPSGMELDCMMYENLYFDSLNADYDGTISCYTLIDGIKSSINFSKYGTFNNHKGAKCVIFPKGKTTWEGFHRPFKAGDIVSVLINKRLWYGIYEKESNDILYCYVSYSTITRSLYNTPSSDVCSINSISEMRFATENEKQELFDAIKANNYKWNPETKTLENLPKFKDGDVIANNTRIVIFHKLDKIPNGIRNDVVYYHCWYHKEDNNSKFKIDFGIGYASDFRFATDEEKQILFDTIKANGYKWVEETKTLEKLIIPKFKVGDKITYRDIVYTIVGIDGDYYSVKSVIGEIGLLPIFSENAYDLIPKKFDISSLKPYDKVLVRDDNNSVWINAFFGFYDTLITKRYPFVASAVNWAQCIPYEGNEHLLNTTDDCDEFYKNW